MKESLARKDSRGFTLVELVIVIAILAILTGLLAPQYTRYIERTRMTSDAENLNEMVKAFQVSVADLREGVKTGQYIITISEEETTFWGPGSVSIPTEVSVTTASESSEVAEDELDEALKNSINTDAYENLFQSMCDILGKDWLDTQLKSDNWQEASGASIIEAYMDLGTDGSVTVSYNPAKVKEVTAKLDGESNVKISEEISSESSSEEFE